MFTLVLLLFACKPERDCVDVRPVGAFPNHVSPLGVTLDPVRRRVWTTAVQSPTLAEIDADSGQQRASRRVFDLPTTGGHPAVDSAGRVWIASRSRPALERYDPSVGDRVVIDGFDEVTHIRTTPSGIVVLADVAGVRSLALLSDTGVVLGSYPAEGYSSFFVTSTGVSLVGTDLLDVVLPGLTEGRRVALDTAMQYGAALPDGSVALGNGTEAAWVDPDGTLQTWAVGRNNGEVVAAGEVALILDRRGPDDPNTGVAWVLGPDGVQSSFPTGHLTAFGAYDGVTGDVWVNSEGSSEVLAFHVATGEPVHAVRTGTWLDGIALQQDQEKVWFGTGRLSNSISRVQAGVVTATTYAVRWPYSPLLDDTRGLLWVLSHTDVALVSLDRDTLAVRDTIPLGVAPNELLTFSTLAPMPSRGTLFVAESQEDAVFEVDLDQGRVVGRWELGGPSLTEQTEIGELSMREVADTGVLIVARSNDGRLQRLDVTTGELKTVWLTSAQMAGAGEDRRIDMLRVYPEKGILYDLGHAFAIEDLHLVPERSLAMGSVAGPLAGRAAQWLGISEDGRSLVRSQEGAGVVQEVPVAARALNAVQLRLGEGGRVVVVTRANEGTACRFDVGELE